MSSTKAKFARALIALAEAVNEIESLVPENGERDDYLSIEDRRLAQSLASAMATLLTAGASAMDADNRYNAIRVTKGSDGKTLFIPLPRDQWALTGNKCQCEHCKASGQPSYWDTIAVSLDADHTWTVHAPELHKNK